MALGGPPRTVAAAPNTTTGDESLGNPAPDALGRPASPCVTGVRNRSSNMSKCYEAILCWFMRLFSRTTLRRGIFIEFPRHTGAMASLMNPRRGRPSKGERHTFAVKLDMERAVKLVEILRLVDISGVEYLTPIIEEHIDAIDLDQLHNMP